MKNHTRIYIDTFLILFLASYLSRFITIPEFTVPNDILINPVFTNIDILTNYARFLLIFTLGLLSCYLSYSKKFSTSEKILNSVKNFEIKKISFKTSLLFFVFLLIIFKGNIPLFSKLSGSAGESEFWGYLPSLSEYGFSQIFTVHGGIDVIPSLIASHFFGEHKTIIGTRLMIFYLVPAINLTLIYLVIYYGFLRNLSINYRTNLSVVIILTLFFFDNYLFNSSFHNFFFLINLLFLQIGILEDNKDRFSVYFFLVGFSSLIGLLYTFDRGIYTLALNVIFLFLIFFSKPTNFKYIYISFFSGLFASAILITLLFEVQNLNYFFENIKFLISTGKYCCVTPSFMDYTHSSSNYSIFRTTSIFSINLSLVIFTTFLILKKMKQKDIKKTINSNLNLITILISQLLFYRIIIYLNDQEHLLQSLLMTPVLISYVLIFFAKKISIQKPLIIILVSILFLFKGDTIKSSLLNYYAFVSKYKVHHDKDLYHELINGNNFKKISNLIDKQNCLYTLTNNLTWNYIFKKPYCSKYHYNFINLSKKSQEETINQLKIKKPEYILFEGKNINASSQYGVSTKSMNYLIYDYIIKSYEPAFDFNNNWFWKLKSKQTNKVNYNKVFKGKIFQEKREQNFLSKLKTLSGISKNIVDFSNFSDIQIKVSFQNINNTNMYAVLVKNENDKTLSGKLLNSKNYAVVEIPQLLLKKGKNKIKVILMDSNNELFFFKNYSLNIKD